jgi:hypothetical protein
MIREWEEFIKNCTEEVKKAQTKHVIETARKRKLVEDFEFAEILNKKLE